MSVRLRPLREDEYAEFAEVSRLQYAEELHTNGGLTREQAAAKAQHDFAAVLPNGLATPGQTISVIEEIAGGERVGRLWFARRELDGQTVAYLYDITIDESRRGQGLGRAAMLAFEAEAARQGHDVLELNVFSGNSRARRLYHSLGYVETAVHMRKALVTNP